MLTRRRFLKQSSLIGTGLLLGGNLFAQRSPKKLSVICIGAGFSGLAAAHLLKKNGIQVTVLESQNRIGGRVHSHTMGGALVVELGGEWVGNSHTRMQELCSQFGLPLQNNQLETHRIYKGQYAPPGKWDYSAAWKTKFKAILENYQNLTEADKHALDKYDWWRFLINNGCDGEDLDMRELMDSTDFGESIRHVSAFAALAEYAESSEKNEMDLKIKGGNNMLAQKLADAIGRNNILLGHTVIKIEQRDKVTVHCANGKTLVADKLICCLPTFAMRRIDWQPGLPTDKLDAINELQYARINKHALQFSERFWKDEAFDLITDESPHYFYHATKNQPGKSGVLISYTIGEKAAVAANQNNAAHARDVVNTLSPHFGNIAPLIQSQQNFYWGNNDYTRGAYALYGINQWFRLRPILGEPFLNTHFAGEHLADWQGFMEGAINTGENAAGEII